MFAFNLCIYLPVNALFIGPFSYYSCFHDFIVCFVICLVYAEITHRIISIISFLLLAVLLGLFSYVPSKQSLLTNSPTFFHYIFPLFTTINSETI